MIDKFFHFMFLIKTGIFEDVGIVNPLSLIQIMVPFTSKLFLRPNRIVKFIENFLFIF